MPLTNSEQTIRYHLLLAEVNVPYLNLCIPSFYRCPQGLVSFGFLRKKHYSLNSDTYFSGDIKSRGVSSSSSTISISASISVELVLLEYVKNITVVRVF